MAPIHPAATHLGHTQTSPVYVVRALDIFVVANFGAQLLTAQGASDTLTYMQSYWQNVGGTDEELWEHEWAKHGTCMRSVLISITADLGSPFHSQHSSNILPSFWKHQRRRSRRFLPDRCEIVQGATHVHLAVGRRNHAELVENVHALGTRGRVEGPVRVHAVLRL